MGYNTRVDELHKMPGWKNYLKGIYDTKPSHLQILVTGSARLDIYDQLGDSLAGRYFRHRLLSLSLAELKQANHTVDLERLLSRGGFPEPYFEEQAVDAERWRMQYKNSLLSTDVFEIERIQNIKAIQLIVELLRHRVGSPISYQSLSEDVGVSPTTVKLYIQILEALYIIFKVRPFSKNIAVILNHEVEQMIEVKSSDASPSPSLVYFQKKYQYPAIQVVKSLRQEYKTDQVTVMSAQNFLSTLLL